MKTLSCSLKGPLDAFDMRSSYLSDYLDPTFLFVAVTRMAKILSQYDYDALAFSGNSGALIAAPLSLATGKPLLLVRKYMSNCHAGFRVEGLGKIHRYVIVDDFIDTGNTVRRIRRAVSEHRVGSICIGILLAKEAMQTKRIKSFVLTNI
jgi:adenine/guanine phosphoribosyltransferase-like PRPP-binding protein